MIVCVCNAKNDRAVRDALQCTPGISTPAGVHRAMGCKPQCGRCLPALAEIAAHYPGRLEVVSGDALKIDFDTIAASAGSPVGVVANLPYNIGTELLLRWLTPEKWPPFYLSLTLMFQREVAERIAAAPGSRSYGRLGVLAGWRTQAHILFDVPRQAFTPPPKVTSAVIRIVPRAAPALVSLTSLGRITQAAFGQRRKMLRQSLKNLGGETLLDAAGIDGTRRAETLSIEEFVALANALPSAKA